MRFDRSQFSELIAGDRQLFLALLELFSQDWPSLMSQIDQARAQKDWAVLEQASHRLKGNLRNFFAQEIAALLGDIEEQAKLKAKLPTTEKLTLIENEIRELERELQEYLADI
jgi:HPt (histidine-containing phosphotransfer) domain-containing protein